MSYILDAEQASHRAGCSCRLCDPFRPNPRARRSPVKRQSAHDVALELAAELEYLRSQQVDQDPGPSDADFAPAETWEVEEWLEEVPARTPEARVMAPVRRISARKDPWLTVRKWGRGF